MQNSGHVAASVFRKYLSADSFYIRELILNSTISFSLYRIIEISAQSVLAISSVGLLLLAVFTSPLKSLSRRAIISA